MSSAFRVRCMLWLLTLLRSGAAPLILTNRAALRQRAGTGYCPVQATPVRCYGFSALCGTVISLSVLISIDVLLCIATGLQMCCCAQSEAAESAGTRYWGGHPVLRSSSACRPTRLAVRQATVSPSRAPRRRHAYSRKLRWQRPCDSRGRPAGLRVRLECGTWPALCQRQLLCKASPA